MTVACPRPKCTENGFENPGSLAAHLIDAHGMAGISALALARQTAGEVRSLAQAVDAEFPAKPLPTKEAPMRKCGKCGATGHKADNTTFHPKDGSRAGTKGGGGDTEKKPRATKWKASARRHPRKAKGVHTNGNLIGQLQAALTEFEVKRADLRAVCEELGVDPAKLGA